jgi:cell division protein FtsL
MLFLKHFFSSRLQEKLSLIIHLYIVIVTTNVLVVYFNNCHRNISVFDSLFFVWDQKLLFNLTHAFFRLALLIDYTSWSKIFSSLPWIFVTFLGFTYLFPYTLGIFVLFYNLDKHHKFFATSSDCRLSTFNHRPIIPMEISTIFLNTPRKRIEYDNLSHPDAFLLKHSRVRSVKTQLICCLITSMTTCFDSQSHHQVNLELY